MEKVNKKLEFLTDEFGNLYATGLTKEEIIKFKEEVSN